jgi:hypothetical protein
MPYYPTYASQPFTGNPPGLVSAGPADLRASSSTGPSYQARIDRMYGRHLAGLGEVQDEAVDQGYALNELRLMEHLDDVSGNGVFDPPGTHPNLYRDAGVFAGRFGIPGYIDREVMYKVGEVVDATTGRNVVYVPSGAVAIDSAAQVAYIEGQRYAAPSPVLRTREGRKMRGVPTWNAEQHAGRQPSAGSPSISGLPFGLSYNSASLLAGIVGLAGAVAVVALLRKK